jgi:hypothetical protein
VQLD